MGSSVSSWANNALNNLTSRDIIICTGVLCSLLWQWSRFKLRLKSTTLSGPPAQSWLFGVSRDLFEAADSALLKEEWAGKYGSVYRIPLALGSSRVELCDPKAVAYFYARESTGFKRGEAGRILIERVVRSKKKSHRLDIDSPS
jgi:hypothetical protein